MPAITYQDFSGGLDRRLPVTVQEASRLWTLRNAYITLGKRIAKRPGLRQVSGSLAGTDGLKAANGGLLVFATVGDTVGSMPAGVSVVYLNDPLAGSGGSAVVRIHYAEMFNGYLYVVAEHFRYVAPTETRVFQHHYIDGGLSTIIADAPLSKTATKAASRIFSADGDVVKYCAAGDARDWTTSSDAGFLPTGLQQDTTTDATAVGTFQDSLCVFFEEGVQIWSVAVDPSANAIRKRVYGVGTKAHMSLASFSNDLAFLSPFGFRSMTVSANTDRIDDTDLGVPVDKLVVADIAAADAVNNRASVQTFGVWIQQLGQYWCCFDMGLYSKVWAYSYSKSSKLACWSEYVFPVKIEAIATVAGVVYVADSARNLYAVDSTVYTDAGDPITVEVQMAFQDAKLPGVLKQFYGADMVVEGSAALTVLYDPRDLAKESIAQTVSGDTRPGDMIPVEVQATSVAPVFRHEADEPFELAALSLYYNSLGTV